MQRTPPKLAIRWRRPTSFTLVELLTVMLIIAILTALTLAAASGVMNTAARGRAKGEIQAISSALESYKVDNGIYPAATNLLGGTTLNYPTDPTTNAGAYQQDAAILYLALASRTNSTAAISSVYPATGKTYMSFTSKQIGSYVSGTTTNSYVQDPWNYAYGYSTGDGTAANPPANGTNFFDLWSTGGLITNVTSGGTLVSYATNTWLSNWH